MSDNEPSAKVPLLVSLGLLVTSLIVAAGGGFFRGSVFAALLAFGAMIPAGYATWLGMQSKGQGKAVGGIVLLLAGVGMGGLMIILRLWRAIT